MFAARPMLSTVITRNSRYRHNWPVSQPGIGEQALVSDDIFAPSYCDNQVQCWYSISAVYTVNRACCYTFSYALI